MKKSIALLFSLVKTSNVLSRKLSGHGLDFSDFMILYHLNDAPDKKLRRIDLANKLGLTASGITRMLLPLEKLGIITRELDHDDARARYASLTKAGLNLLKDATVSIEMKLEDIFPEGSQKQIADSADFLEIINRAGAVNHQLAPEKTG